MNPIEILTHLYSQDFSFVDIGAYRGEYTQKVLKSFPGAKGLLIEPTRSSFNYLSNQFSQNPNLKIVKIALGVGKGDADYFSFKDSAQNSLLESVDSTIEVSREKILVESLDSVLEYNSFLGKIDFIKIDTQGNDLNVVRGGIETIQKNKPALLTEIIFVPLYKRQCNYYDQWTVLNDLDYKVVGFYNMHFHVSGCLAFADCLLLPSGKYEQLSQEVFPGSDFIWIDSAMIEENKELKSICDQRLELINLLSKEAEKRLTVINILNDEIARLKGSN